MSSGFRCRSTECRDIIVNEIKQEILKLKDEGNAAFQAKLAPTIDPGTCLGTRLPELRKLAIRAEKMADYEVFLNELPHEYYDENIFHSILISRMKPYDKCLNAVERFLPYVDNWAVCDTLRPKIFAKNKAALMPEIIKWAASEEVYTCRFGIDMLMTYYLDEDFEESQLEIPASIVSEEYYVNMMIAWYYATALAKQWDAAIPYIEKNRLSVWTHNKTIQKARESFRITDEQKEYLKSLKRKN